MRETGWILAGAVCGLTLVWLVFFGLGLVHGDARPIPRSQWDAEARVTLARAMIGEAGWGRDEDHAGIAWVLAKRWRMRRHEEPDVRFVDMVRRYAAPLRPDAPRQWVLEMPVDGVTKPEHWPTKLVWEWHIPHWKRLLRYCEAWSRGRVPDPFPRAIHYGGPMDPERGQRVSFRTANSFYAPWRPADS